jgi:hypothetical protein
MGERQLDVTIVADGELVKNDDVFNTYFSELGNTGELLEDAVEKHLEAQGVTPTRRLNTNEALYDVGIKVKKEVYIPPLETEPINGKRFKVTFKYRPIGGRRRRTVKRRRNTRVKTFRTTTKRVSKNGRRLTH